MVKRIKNFFTKLGPGLVTGASDDDPSGITTYSQAGAQFGFSTLWTALLTFPLMASLQETCARIGLVSKKGLSHLLKEYYPKWLVVFILVVTTPAIILNIGSDIAGMGAVSHLLVPGIGTSIFSIFFTVVLIIAIIWIPYQKMAMVLKYLCLSMLVYFIVPFMTHVDLKKVITHTFIPTIKFDKEFLSILVAILGTTISPYLFFWQTVMEVEDVNKNKGVRRDKLLKNAKTDVNTGMLMSNLVMYFVILTTAVVLFQNGQHKIDTIEQAASALKPLAGRFAYYLFAIGVIGTGLLTIPVLGGTLSYIFSEACGWKGSLDKKFFEAKSFYAVMIAALLIGLGINYVGLSPIKALLYTAILYGLTAPVMIAVIMHIANNKKIMKDSVNGKLSNIMGWATFGIMSVAAVFLIYTSFL
jgi:NRAMP (natural resistance-associated macrophage protein)-like metal ion transporter